jgi:hypothetical protein
MSDITLNRFVSRGTAAERAAFTPDPPTPASGPDPGYFWLETDTGSTYAWTGSAWQLVGGGGGPVGASQNSFLVSGGQVVWIEDYVFRVSAAVYFINGLLYSSPETEITLDAADVSDDRIDIIGVDDQGDVIFVTGTPAAQPSEPDVDPSTQLKLGIVFVEASTTEPGTATAVPVYAENAGDPAEWDWSSSGSGWALGSTTNPRTGTTDIEATAITSGAYIQGQIGSGTFDPNLYGQLVLYIRSKASWTNNRTLQIRLQNAGAVVGATLTIGNNQFGFDSSVTAAYQQIAIPIAQFAVPAGQVITQIRLTRAGGSSIGFYLDDVSFVGGAITQPGTGITQEQSDARYAPLGPGFVTTAAEAGLPNERRLVAGANITITDGGAGGTVTIAAPRTTTCGVTFVNPTAGDEFPLEIPVACTITVLRMVGNAAGSAVLDIRKDTFANFPPTVTESITAAAKPTLSAAQTVEDTTLPGWTLSIAAGEWLMFHVDSASGLAWLQLQLTVTIP